MRDYVRSLFDITADSAVVAATAARDTQAQSLSALEQQKAEIDARIAANTALGEKYRHAVQARLNERAAQAEPALERYEAVSYGRILYDQLGQLVSKIYDTTNQAVRNDMQSYGYKSKQFFSAAICADALTRHLAEWRFHAGAFDQLAVPFMQELEDTGLSPAPVAPLLEFAHQGCHDPAALTNSILQMKADLARHRARAGGAYASGRRVDWESFLAVLKFNLTTTTTTTTTATSSDNGDRSLIDKADACAARIEHSARSRAWQECHASVGELWTILAPTIRGNPSERETNAPLLQSLFDIRAAVEERMAGEFVGAYAAGLKQRSETAFTMKLFEMQMPPPQHAPPQQAPPQQ